MIAEIRKQGDDHLVTEIVAMKMNVIVQDMIEEIHLVEVGIVKLEELIMIEMIGDQTDLEMMVDMKAIEEEMKEVIEMTDQLILGIMTVNPMEAKEIQGTEKDLGDLINQNQAQKAKMIAAMMIEEGREIEKVKDQGIAKKKKKAREIIGAIRRIGSAKMNAAAMTRARKLCGQSGRKNK
jgi:hypothetical protein